MKAPTWPAEAFGLVVRIIGLSLLVYSIWYLVYGVATVLGLPEDVPGYRLGYWISGMTFLLLSLYLLKGAPHVVRFSYSEKRLKEPGEL